MDVLQKRLFKHFLVYFLLAISTPIIMAIPPISCVMTGVSFINNTAKSVANKGMKFKNILARLAPIAITPLFQLRKATIDANVPTYKMAKIVATLQFIVVDVVVSS